MLKLVVIFFLGVGVGVFLLGLMTAASKDDERSNFQREYNLLADTLVTYDMALRAACKYHDEDPQVWLTDMNLQKIKEEQESC